MAKKIIQIHVTPEEHEAVRRIADEYGLNFTGFVKATIGYIADHRPALNTRHIRVIRPPDHAPVNAN
jgi:hypothetical protein